MTDRFKFRAWDDLIKKMFFFDLKDLWRDGCEMQLSELNDPKHLSLSSEFPYENIMQCTGLKDKNDKLIYEGDILKCVCDIVTMSNSKPTGKKSITFSSVEHHPDKAQFSLRENRPWWPESKLNTDGMRQPSLTRWFEIVGNIYENGDLLK